MDGRVSKHGLTIGISDRGPEMSEPETGAGLPVGRELTGACDEGKVSRGRWQELRAPSRGKCEPGLAPGFRCPNRSRRLGALHSFDVILLLFFFLFLRAYHERDGFRAGAQEGRPVLKVRLSLPPVRRMGGQASSGLRLQILRQPQTC